MNCLGATAARKGVRHGRRKPALSEPGRGGTGRKKDTLIYNSAKKLQGVHLASRFLAAGWTCSCSTDKGVCEEVHFCTFFSKNAKGKYLPIGYRLNTYNEFSCCYFTGKEKDTETGYGYFGARYMDHELMTMWLSVDPMADKYPSISPYAYCAWNPVKLVDPDGNELTDFYDAATGEHLKHVDDGIDEAIAIDRTVFNALEDDNVSTSVEKEFGVSLGRNSDFVALAGTLYAESTPRESSFEEMAGIGSVIRNRAIADGISPIDVISGGGIYGYNHRDKIYDLKANKSKVNLAYKAAMLTLCTKTDYSDGGYFWQGNDFRVSNSPANKEYYQKGFNFTDKSHDRFGTGSRSIAGRVPYKYESTAAAAGTVFLRLTDKWMNDHGATKWNGR